MRIRIIVASVVMLVLVVSGLVLWRGSQPKWEPPTAENITAVRIDGHLLDLDQAEEELAVLFAALKRARIRRTGKSGVADQRVVIIYGDNRELKLLKIGGNIEVGIKDHSYRAKVFIVSRKVSEALEALVLSVQETREIQQ